MGQTLTGCMDEIESLDRARFPIVYLVTADEQRMSTAVVDVAKRRKRKFWAWSISQGFHQGPKGGGDRSGIVDPTDALREIIKDTEDTFYLLKDFDEFLDNPVVARLLRDIAIVLKNAHKTVFISATTLRLPVSLEKSVYVLDFPLPDAKEIEEMLDGVVERIKGQGIDLTIDNGKRESLVNAARGLTYDEAENAFARSLVAVKDLDVGVVTREKQQTIRKSGILEYVDAEERLADVGGLDRLKEWLHLAGLSQTDKARAYGVDPVKGVLLLGIPGGGKSLTAKAIAAEWGIPLIRADLGRLYGGIVGDTERNTRRMTEMAEAVAPCVLWMDEIEKGLGGMESSSQTSGGVELRLFGHLLTWMQEYKARVFLVATANDVRSLRPEFLRRFRHVFFVDLPTETEREQILRIHITKRKRNPEEYDIPALVKLTNSFTGAEIEKAVQEGILSAFASSGGKRSIEVEQATFEEAARGIIPVSKTMSEQVADLKAWVSSGRARPASSLQETVIWAGGRNIEVEQ